jgi:hypothetical protein
MKTLWLTSIASDEASVKQLMAQMKPYGLEVQGHFWKDDLAKMAWMAAREKLLESTVAVWAIMALAEELKQPDIRYGLSLLTLTVQAQRGLHFTVLVLQTGKDPIVAETLPTPLKGAEVLAIGDTSLGAKLVAKAHTTGRELWPDYYLDVYGNEQIGQWFEIGPRRDSWQGAMFGVCGGTIEFQAVGPRGKLPSRSVLGFPLQGLQLNLGETVYTAWAVQNDIGPEDSYFVKVDGFPESIVWGPYTEGEAADLFRMTLK